MYGYMIFVRVNSTLVTNFFFFFLIVHCFLFAQIGRELFFCVAIGLWAGLVIGFVTEYYTSNAYRLILSPLCFSFF